MDNSKINIKDDVRILEYQKDNRLLTKEFKEENELLYKVGILVAMTSDLKYGHIVKRYNKPTSKGTKFTYKPVESEEEVEKYVKKIEKEFNKFDKEELVRELEKFMLEKS